VFGLNDECFEIFWRKVIFGHMLLNSGWNVRACSAMRLFIESAIVWRLEIPGLKKRVSIETIS
jgi:hypothetical protein